ncbi:MAG TPA: hypothetical protein PLB01_10630 [Thermoanaerobaculia bacterium]|nr:hypothetical protein [Thermoanaerobaculia bacterium]
MKRRLCLTILAALTLASAAPRLGAQEQAREPEPSARTAPLAGRSPLIFASPIHGGCYIAAPGQCKIHVEPFTINISSGTKLALFKLVSIQLPGNVQTTIYDWRPDQSNPAPASGTTYTPSLVTQDFAATCGNSYQISLQGRDTGDVNTFNLGLTGTFTCPTTVP